MSSEVKEWFSASELSLLGKHGVAALPDSRQGCKWRAQSKEWKSRETKGRGGPGGVRIEYHPPDDVLIQVHAFLNTNPDFFKEKRGSAARKPIEPLASHKAEHPEFHYGIGKAALAALKDDTDRVATTLATLAGMAVSSADWLPADMPKREKFNLANQLYKLLVVLVGSDQKKLNYLVEHPEFTHGALRFVHELEMNGSVKPPSLFF